MTRAARSLDTLLAQVNDLAPKRSKKHDGGIGDLAHAARTSDHNPVGGVFHARDITHDPAHGFDSYAFADRLLAAQDHRLKYVISNGRIGSGPAGPHPGVWRKYDGDSKHDQHVHVSVVGGAAGEQTQPWVIGPFTHSRPGKQITDRAPDQKDDDMAEISKEQEDRIVNRIIGTVAPSLTGGKDLDPGHVSVADLYRLVARVEQKLDALDKT